MSGTTAVRHPVPDLVQSLDVAAKVALVVLLATAIAYPELGNIEDKGAGLRAVGYPMVAFTVPALWYLRWRDRAPFPWLADLLVTLTCFTDTLGNRMDLYDTVVWFDDVMHFVNVALLSAAVILLSLPPTATLGQAVERALAFGGTAALAWEVAEYFAFVSRSTERRFAYADTLGDLALGWLGALAAAVVIHGLWRRGRLWDEGPRFVETHPAAR
ncbi:MAG TPA: hypothetical protein VFZ64_00230 [Nocardioidaceae bacterium]